MLYELIELSHFTIPNYETSNFQQMITQTKGNLSPRNQIISFESFKILWPIKVSKSWTS